GAVFGMAAPRATATAGAGAGSGHALAGGCVGTVQTGRGNEEVLARHVERVIRGTTFPAGKLVEPGHVQWDVKGDTTLGPYDERTALEEVERLADACTRAGMPTHAVPDARGPQGRQGSLNAAANAIGAPPGPAPARVCE